MPTLPKPVRRGPRPKKRIRTRVTLGAKRRAAKASGYVDPDTWEAILAFYGYRCAMECGRSWEEQGHVISIAHGGRHCAGNVVPLCKPCNQWIGRRVVYPLRRHPWLEYQ